MNEDLIAQDKEALYDVVFYKNPLPMWYFDQSTLQFLEVNSAAVDRYGYSREEFLQLTIRDIRPPDDVYDLLENLSDTTAPFERKNVFRHSHKDGTLRYVKIISYPAKFHNRPARLVMVNDVTETMLYVERFDMIAKATQDAVWDWNLATNELWLNQSFFDLFGYHKEEMGKTVESWLRRIHPEDQERVQNGIHQAIQRGEANWSDEYHFCRADGTYAYVIDRGYTLFKDGKAVRMLGAMMDTTLQNELKSARQETDSLLRKITGAAPTALWMSDAMGDLVYVNQTWINWSNNHSFANLVEGWVSIIHPDDRDRVKATFSKAHETYSGYSLDYRVYFPDGSCRWLTSTANPRYNSQNEFMGLVGSCTDITRQKHLELQKDGFISTVSHELKTPIAAIKGYGQLLSRSNAVIDGAAANFLTRMRSQINRLDSLVQDLLDVSRIESGKLTFDETEFAVNLLLEDLIADLQIVFPSHSLTLVANEPCRVFADQNRLIQLITNLVDNAVKYSPGAQQVIIRLDCDEENLTVSIQDFGKGIPAEQEPYVFERFFQVNNVYKAPGLGIGLYVCREIINRLQGKIWFKSRPGEGSIFYFRIPRKLD